MSKYGTPIIETENFIMRPLTIDDAEAMFGWAGDPDVVQYLTFPQHKNLDDTRKVLNTFFLPNYKKSDYYCWAVQLKQTGEVIGVIDILQRVEGEDALSWQPGYAFARKHWGKGYATQALKAAVQYFFEISDIQELHCRHEADNTASGRVMQKAGFVFIKDTKEKQDDKILDIKVYALKKEDFLNKQ